MVYPRIVPALALLFTSGFAKRHTFYIDKEGAIAKIDTAVRPATSAEDMIANLAELGVPARP